MRDETAKADDKLVQPGILDAVPPVARHLRFTLAGPRIDAPPMRAGRFDLRRLGLGA